MRTLLTLRTVLTVAFLIGAVCVNGCKKDDNPLSTGGGGMTNPFDFPIPDVANVRGGVGVVSLSSPAAGSVIYGIGAFEDAGSFVYAGVVTANNVSLDTTHYGTDLIYMKSVTDSVTFNNSATTSFNVEGAGTIPAFNGSIVPPNASAVTSPVNNANVSIGSNLNVQWDNSGLLTDTVIVTIENFITSQSLAKSRVSNTGSCTISAAELASLGAGQSVVTLTKYRYTVVTQNTKRFLVFAESSNIVYVTLQ